MSRSTFVGDERGQSLIEIALLLPLLLLIVVGLVDVGRAYAVKAAATSAAREAALYAARDPQAVADAICGRALRELAPGTSPGSCTLDLVSEPGKELWRSSNPAAIVTCYRVPADASASPVPCGHDNSTRLYQTDGEAGATVTVTVRASVSLTTFSLANRIFAANPVVVSGSATFGGLR